MYLVGYGSSVGSHADDDGIDAWPEDPTRLLDQKVIEFERPRGGVKRDEVAHLLGQINIFAAAEADAALVAKQRLEKRELDQRYWQAVRLPILVRRYRSRKRPDVVARFAALVFAEDRRTSSAASWFVSGYLAWTDAGDFVVEQMTVEPDVAGRGGLTPDVLRAISVPQIVAGAQAAMRFAPEFASFARRARLVRDTDQPEDEAELEAEAAALAALAEVPPPRGGRRGFPPAFYRWVAKEYLRLHDAGVGRGILIRLAELASARLGRDVSREQMRDHVHRARELGFLEKRGHQGKAGALPGPKLRTRTREARSQRAREENDG
jgi:hypothetical protein